MATRTTNTYNRGQEVRSTVTFAVSGVATDPTAVLFKTQDPSGNETTYTFGVDANVVKSSVGNYYADWTLDEEGRWYYRWEGTGTVIAAAEHALEVRDSEFY